MHDTLLPSIKSHIDKSKTSESGTINIVGWAFNVEEKKPLDSLRVVFDNTGDELKDHLKQEYNSFIERKDVSEFYKNESVLFCGVNWEIDNLNYKTGHLQTYIDNEWKTFKVITFREPNAEELIKEIKIANETPALTVVENFYSDPEAIRKYAMSLKFEESGYHKGKRTQGVSTIFNGTKEFLETTLGKKITKWDYGTNGVFQYCTAQDALVYHTDGQTYAAVVFLTPDAPPECGTSFFRHKELKIGRYPTQEDEENIGKDKDSIYWEMFKGNFYDKTPWELVDNIGNVYNRMVIWDAKKVHAASEYFGDSIENSRLFHMFFFDAE